MSPRNLPLNLLTKKWYDMFERIDENQFAQAFWNCFVDTINFKR